MNYLMDEYLRNLLLEYFEEREDVKDGDGGRQEANEEMSMAMRLRDLKPLREVEIADELRRLEYQAKTIKLVEDALFGNVGMCEPTREEMDDRNARAREHRGWNV